MRTQQQVALSSVNVAVEQVVVPKNYLDKGRGWVLQGSKHDFMPRVLNLIRRSPTATALFNRKTSLVAGDGFRVNVQLLPALAVFLKKVASSGKHRTGDQLLKRVAKDYVRLRGFAIQVVWAADGLHIAELYHQRFETVACSVPNDRGEVESYWVCRDWAQKGKYKPVEIPAYNPDRAKLRGPVASDAPAGTPGPLLEPVQLYYHFEEEPGVECYPALDYEPGLPYMELEGNLATFHNTNVATGFRPVTAIMIPNGPVDKPEEGTAGQPDYQPALSAAKQRQMMEEGLKRKHTGPGGQNFMLFWGDGTPDSADKVAKITAIDSGTPETYETYTALAQQAILSACSCTSPMVAGLPSANGGALGGNSQELYQAFKLFFNANCLPDQNALLEGFRELLGKVADVDFSQEPDDAEQAWLDIIGSLPVEYTFSEAVMELILTDDELRHKIGYKPLPAGAKPAADPATPATGPTASAPHTPAA